MNKIKNIFEILPDHQMKIGVIGSASGGVMRNKKAIEGAGIVGKEIAKSGSILVSGACPGLPDVSARFAKKYGGLTMGISPAASIQSHITKYKSPIDHYDTFFFTGAGLVERNILNIRAAHGIITLPGGIGTLHEWATAFDEGKPIGILTGHGGVADHIDKILDFCSRPKTDRLIFNDDPEKLVKDLYHLVKNTDSPAYLDDFLIGDHGEVTKAEAEIKKTKYSQE